MPDDPLASSRFHTSQLHFADGRAVNIHCHMPLPILNAVADLVKKSDQLLNISGHLQRKIDELKADQHWAKTCQAINHRMLEDKIEEMVDEQKKQVKHWETFIEEHKALCEHWEMNMEHWRKNMERWQRHDSAAGSLRQRNATASVRRTAAEAGLDDDNRIASRRKAHGGPQPKSVTTTVCHRLATCSKAASKAVPPPRPPPGPPSPPPGQPPSQLLDPVPLPGPPLAPAAERSHSELLSGSLRNHLDLYLSSPRPSRGSRDFSAATVQYVESRIAAAKSRLERQRVVATSESWQQAWQQVATSMVKEELSPLSEESAEEAEYEGAG